MQPQTLPRELADKKVPETLQEHIASCAAENNAGAFRIRTLGEMTVASLTLQPLPPYDKVDSSIVNLREKLQAKNRQRLPFYRGRYDLFWKLIELSEAQYLHGVPAEVYAKSSYPEAPARFSLYYDYNHYVPTTIVAPAFETTLRRVEQEPKTANALTKGAQGYVKEYDRAAGDWDIGQVRIAQYGIFSNGYDFAYGHRGMPSIQNEVDLASLPNFRIQSNDVYRASIHNSGIASYEEIFAMLAVGMINRLALHELSPGLIK